MQAHHLSADESVVNPYLCRQMRDVGQSEVARLSGSRRDDQIQTGHTTAPDESIQSSQAWRASAASGPPARVRS